MELPESDGSPAVDFSRPHRPAPFILQSPRANKYSPDCKPLFSPDNPRTRQKLVKK